MTDTSHRWDLTDGTATYTLHINPHEGGTPGVSRAITHVPNVDPTGAGHYFQGPLSRAPVSVSGTVLTGEHQRELENWAAKNAVIRVTDDLGRVFDILMENFEPSRKRSRRRWRHEYTLRYHIVAIIDRGDP